MHTTILSTTTLRCTYSSDEHANPALYSAHHFHNDYELFFCLSGKMDYIVGGLVYTLSTGDVLLIPPSVFHYPKPTADKKYERFVINFRPSELSKKLRPFLNEAQTHYAFAGNAFVEALPKMLLDFSPAEKEDVELALRQCLNVLLLQMKHSKTGQNVAQVIHPTLSKILKYIDEHLAEELNAETLANTFFVSGSWVYYVFKKNLNISLSAYVNQKKILHAQRLIQSGTPPTKAYLMCGFKEYSTFYRQYVRRFGAPPVTDK